METVLIRIIQLFMSLSILVLIHEFGHFIFSKLFKVRVEKFCLFFDPWFTLFKFKPKKSDTEYCMGWLPLGGYVKISGMIDESMDTEQMKQPEQPWEFRSKPAWQRLLIMIGGVLFNFILAIIIYGMILFTWGESTLTPKNPELGLDFSQTALNAGFHNGDILIDADGKSLEEDAQSIMIPRRNGIYSNVDLLRTVANARVIKVKRNGQDAYVHLTEEMGQNMIMDSVYFANYRFPYIVDSVIDGGAKVAGLMKGDRIIAVDGNETPAFSDFERYITSLKDAGQKVDSLQIKYIRNNETNTVSVAMSDDMKMGILYKSEFQFMEKSKKEYSFFASIPAGVTLGVNTMKGYVSDMKYVFTKKGANSLGGFGSIAKIFPKLWDWQRFWEMTALLSIMLAVMNILPIPALDGGHVLFLFYEIITGRKPNDKFLEYAQVAGMILLFGLLIWANLNDIIRFLF